MVLVTRMIHVYQTGKGMEEGEEGLGSGSFFVFGSEDDY